MLFEPELSRTSDSLPEVHSALLKIQEQARLMMANQPDRLAQENLLLIVALARFCLASLPGDTRH